MKTYKVAIVGATGLVGQEILKVLAQRCFPVSKIRLLASTRSVGKKLTFAGEEHGIEETKPESFKNSDIAFFAGAEEKKVSELFARKAVKQGAVVIDNAPSFRMDPNVPLVVPEVNPQDLKWHKGLIANPNCSTIQLVVVLKPLHEVAKVKRAVISTYQSVSGWGKGATEELAKQTRDWYEGSELKVDESIFPHQIAFNLIPQIDRFTDDGYTKEETKLVDETHKIMGDDSIAITATAVRVPVFVGHGESVNIETEKPMSVEEARKILANAPGVTVIDDVENKRYPMPLDCASRDEVFVGRIRKDPTIQNGLNLWIVADNLRKGAALNAVQIGEELIRQELV